MNNPLITICTVNYNSSDFIGLMLFALKKLTFNPYKVIIRDNNSRLKDYLNLQKIIKGSNYSNVFLYRTEMPLTGSLAHGTALNELTTKIDTQYGVIIDADATFLIKNWDKIMIEKINNHSPIFGTQADLLSGKPEDFPLMFAILFETSTFKKMNIDFRPKDLTKYQDTGWELREKYLNHGLAGSLLYSFNTRSYKRGPFSDVVCSEYYLSPKAEGKIFASHFGRGSAPTAKRLFKLKIGNNFLSKLINKILQYPSAVKWSFDKGKWLAVCQKIINTQ